MDEKQTLDEGYGKEYDQLDSKAIGHLSTMVKTTRYIILGMFVFVFMLSITTVIMTIKTNEVDDLPAFICSIFGMLIVFGHPFYFLFSFSKKMAYALNHFDGSSMTEALAKLRSFFNTVLFYLCVYLVILSIMLIAGISDLI
ncbi:hypothetical protein OAK19_01415 [Aureispira]|nr:hypothetical protein [Aureispira sp.]